MNDEKTTNAVTGQVKDNRKKAIIAAAAVAVLLLIAIRAFVVPGLVKSEMPNVVDSRGEKAQAAIMETGVSGSHIALKNYEEGKDLSQCSNYGGTAEKCFVLDTNPKSGESFHTNTDTIVLGVIAADDIFKEAENPDQIIELAEKFDIKYEALNTCSKMITNLIDEKPADWTIAEVKPYDPSSNKITFSVIGSKEYEEKIKKEEEERVKAEEEKKKNEEAAAKKKAEEEAAKKKEAEDKYAYVKKYLSNFEEIDGGGYTVVVDSSIKGDFETLRDCGIYAMKVAYEKLGTDDMGVFGDYDDGEPAFYYDSNVYNSLYVQKDYIVPPGWEYKITSDDFAYIKSK